MGLYGRSTECPSAQHIKTNKELPIKKNCGGEIAMADASEWDRAIMLQNQDSIQTDAS